MALLLLRVDDACILRRINTSHNSNIIK